jgi:hypothetical protein
MVILINEAFGGIMIYFLIILLFIPIPMIIKVNYENKLDVFIYNKRLTLFKNNKKNKKKVSIKDKNIKLLWKPYIRLHIKLLYGFDDAAVTAISYGLIFSVLPIIKIILSRYINVNSFTQDIKLDYKRNIFNLFIKCIILINIAQIIIDLIYIVYLKFKRGVLNGKSSNRQSDEKYYGKS